MNDENSATNTLEGIKLVPNPSARLLNERQLIDYREERENCIDWLLHFGKDPDRADGYSRTTVSNRASRMDQFYRWVWDEEGYYTASVTHDHADAYMEYLAREDYTNSHKDTTRKAVKMLFKWHHHKRGGEMWESPITFNRPNQSTTPRDYLTREERRQICEAALEYGSVPSYNDATGEERERWKTYLAQRFEKPKSEITQDDWERANSWKIPSLVWVSLDAALRPIEVERAVTTWVDLDNGLLRIPKEDASKNDAHWQVGLQERTVEILGRWLKQRQTNPKYDETDALWLTRESNAYQSASLKYILEKLCDIAGISTENRRMSWYAIRHSTGTYMTREEGLAAAQAQLRHLSPESTMKYDQVPVEDRQDALDRMG